MAAILENPEVRALVKKFSVREFERFGSPDDQTRTELVRGVLIEGMILSPLHAYLIGQLGGALQAAADAGFCCRQEQGLKLADSFLMPDLAVVAGNARDYLYVHPATALLVIEIAVSTLGLDREKAALYAEAGVTEYWIVAPSRKAVEVHTQPLGGRYTQHQIHPQGAVVTSAALPALQIEADLLFVE